MMNKLLTPLELKIMNILWKIEKGFVKDILKNWEDGEAPKYNTVSTIVRILASDKKKYVGHETYGRSHKYFPLISKQEYQKLFLNSAIHNVFSGSFSSLVSTFVSQDEVSDKELKDLKRLIDENS